MPTRTFELIYPKKVDSHRNVTEKMIDEIIKNDNAKSRYPVAIGHNAAMGWSANGDADKAAGRFSNLRKDESGMLLGDVSLQPEVDKEFENGAYPGWSVGIYTVTNVDDDKDDANLGWHMDHLALLGSVGAAFKDLQEVKSTAFSIVDESPQGMTVECFASDPNKNKTLWLLQCVPRQPITNEKPAALFSADHGGKNEMDAKEFEVYKAEQESKMAELLTSNEQLKADNKARLNAETDRRIVEFSNVKGVMLKAAADKGVTEPVRTALSKALDSYDAHYAGGVVSKDLFDAITAVLTELKPKVSPGEIFNDEVDDTFVQKQSFSRDEAVGNLIN